MDSQDWDTNLSNTFWDFTFDILLLDHFAIKNTFSEFW